MAKRLLPFTRISRRGLGQMSRLGFYLADDRGVEFLCEFVYSEYCEGLGE